ncbi:hypothetical protein BSKO_07904 [Bryopsis sp. KO-2023]|nr:hypothetical protein BSKO_07904 [Bryopsis sp. KO-2023]
MAGVQAFYQDEITGDIPDKIESLSAWGKNLLLGCADGTFLILEPSEGEAIDGPWRVTNQKKLGRRPINQIDVCESLPAALTLSDEGVALHGLPEVNPLCQVPSTRYASLMSWNASKDVLAVAAKRKLVFYKLQGMDFVELSSMGLPDIALAAAWCGDSVCLGFKKDYQLANPDSNDLKEVSSVGRDRRPVVTSLPGKEILIARENVVLFIGANGKPLRRPAVSWTEAPYAVVVSGPYIVALTSSLVEVRNYSSTARQDVVQMLHVDDLKLAAVTTNANGDVFFAPKLKKQICRLVPVPLAEQVDALAEMDEFQDALELSTLLPEEDRIKVEDVLRVRYGIHLFSQGSYDIGLSQFAMRSQRSPLLPLKMFPSITPQSMLRNFQLPVPEEFFDNYAEPEGDEYREAINSLLPVLLSHRSRLATREFEDAEFDKEQAKLPQISEEAELEEEDNPGVRPGLSEMALSSTKVISRAHRSRLAVLVDTAILKATLATRDTGQLLEFVQKPNSVDLVEGESALANAGRYAELAALYQSHGCHDKGMEILRKVSQDPESLEVPPSGAAREMKGMTGVWSAVRYLSKLSSHDTAVIQNHAGWVLRIDPEAALEVFIGADKRLSPSLVLPILDEHAPQYSVVYLEAMLENGDAKPEEFHGTLVDIYLREALANETKLGPLHKLPGVKELGGMRTPERVKSMRQISAKRLGRSGSGIVPEREDSSSEEGERHVVNSAFDSPKPMESYERLRELVIESDHINPASVLALIPQGKLLELQALLMERSGKVEQALEVYLLELDSLPLVEQLCDRVYEGRRRKNKQSLSELFATDQDCLEAGDIYIMMLKIYLRPQDSQSDIRKLSNEQWRKLAELLSRKRFRINVEQVFKLLPDDVELGVILPFVEGGIRTLSEQQRNLAIVKNLHTCENFEMKEQLISCRQRMINVTTDRACWLCHKRIGHSVVVAYPTELLAHYACYLREEQSQN